MTHPLPADHQTKVIAAGPHPVLQATNVLVASLWVAVCAATPEFIWRGARQVIHHLNAGDLAASVLVGLILAFCIEPAMEQLRHAAAASHDGGHHARRHKPYNLLFRAAIGLAFAFASVCLHDAITTFLASHANDLNARRAGLVAGLQLAGAWTVVPFCVTLAWLTVRRIYIHAVCVVLAVLSPGAAALAFDWSWQDWITTQLPTVCILVLGYRHWSGGAVSNFFRRAISALAWVCLIWLIGMSVLAGLANLTGLGWLNLYSQQEAWIDVRFYFGWMIGLLLAPVPLDERETAGAH